MESLVSAGFQPAQYLKFTKSELTQQLQTPSICQVTLLWLCNCDKQSSTNLKKMIKVVACIESETCGQETIQKMLRCWKGRLISIGEREDSDNFTKCQRAIDRVITRNDGVLAKLLMHNHWPYSLKKIMENATAANQTEILEELTLHKAMISREISSLHRVVLDKNLDELMALISNRIDIDAQDQNGNTALHIACREGYLEGIELLRSHGASLIAINQQGLTPAAYGLFCGQSEFFDLYFDDFNIDFTQWKYIKTNASDAESIDLFNNHSTDKIYSWLNRAPIIPENRSKAELGFLLHPDNLTLFLRPFLQTDLHENEKTYEKLASLYPQNASDLMIFACMHGCIQFIKNMLDQGADPNKRAIQDVYGNADTLLFRACTWNQSEIALVLLAHGADPNAGNKLTASGDIDVFKSQYPIHRAVIYELKDVVLRMVEMGVNLILRDSEGQTPLGCGLRYSKDALEELFFQGFDFFDRFKRKEFQCFQQRIDGLPLEIRDLIPIAVHEWIKTDPLCPKGRSALEVPLLFNLRNLVEEELEQLPLEEMKTLLDDLRQRYSGIDWIKEEYLIKSEAT